VPSDTTTPNDVGPGLLKYPLADSNTIPYKCVPASILPDVADCTAVIAALGATPAAARNVVPSHT